MGFWRELHIGSNCLDAGWHPPIQEGNRYDYCSTRDPSHDAVGLGLSTVLANAQAPLVASHKPKPIEEDAKKPVTMAKTAKPTARATPEAWRKPRIGTSVNAGDGERLSRGLYLLTGRNQP